LGQPEDKANDDDHEETEDEDRKKGGAEVLVNSEGSVFFLFFKSISSTTTSGGKEEGGGGERGRNIPAGGDQEYVFVLKFSGTDIRTRSEGFANQVASLFGVPTP
jgi:hypothetical protein